MKDCGAFSPYQKVESQRDRGGMGGGTQAGKLQQDKDEGPLSPSLVWPPWVPGRENLPVVGVTKN